MVDEKPKTLTTPLSLRTCPDHRNTHAECKICILNRRDEQSDHLNGVCDTCGGGFKLTGRWRMGDGYHCWGCVQQRIDICAAMGGLKFTIRGAPLPVEYLLLGFDEGHPYSKIAAKQIAKAGRKLKTIGRSEAAAPGSDHANLTLPQKRSLARAARGFYLYRRTRPHPNKTLSFLDDPAVGHPLTIDSLVRRRLIEPDNTANSYRATKEGQAVYARRRQDWLAGVMHYTQF